jgi:hypothetical protein
MPGPLRRLFDKLGYGDREYRGGDFSVRVEQGFREIVRIVHTRRGLTRVLDGERIGKRWQGIAVYLNSEIEAGDAPEIVRDLETAFEALRYGYVISRTGGVEVVSEAEQRMARAELYEIGFEVEVSTDGKQTSLKRRSGMPPPDPKAASRAAPRMMSLLRSVRPVRQRVDILARSKDFDEPSSDYIPR